MIVEGYEVRPGTFSDHQKYRVPSRDMVKLKQVMLHTLDAFHQHVEEHRIYYSLQAGSLIGFYCGGDMIPWDDDIDIQICQEDVLHFVELWQSGERAEKITEYQRGFDNTHTRTIELLGEKFEIMMNEPTYTLGKKWLMKLRPVDHDCFHNVPGGLDIATAYTESSGKFIDSWDLRTRGIDPADITRTGCPVVEFGGVKTRALKPEAGKSYLNQKYGDKWSIKKHPSIKLGHDPLLRRLARRLRSITSPQD